MIVLVSACAGLKAAESVSTTPEYRVKAVFLFNFTQFVEWPARAFSEPDSPIIIGILGEDPFGDFIDQVVQGERVNSRPVRVRRISGTEGIAACNILFVSKSESGNIRKTLAEVRGRPILTVSDASEFTRDGGIIRFFDDDHRVRLVINNEAAISDGLKISSKLLRPSRITTASED
ncbi:MAG TPA: YfiR family protein [Opitutaceae bacterium]|nr:YfiR family protein [Opitutaceae bacterium]